MPQHEQIQVSLSGVSVAKGSSVVQEHLEHMNGVGSWYDNAPMESFFGILKSEWVHHYSYRTRDEARASLFFCIESFYNQRRRRSSLGYLSPMTYEEQYHLQGSFA